jgi:predicted N-acetyltransferase YhbS
MDLQIRHLSAADNNGLKKLLIAAFGDGEGPVIVNLVEELLIDPTAQPSQSLVAMISDRVVGYILFTKTELHNSPKPVSSSILAPLAVHPDYQNQGIGGQLIKTGLQQLQSLGVNLVFVLGHPRYYSKYGFAPAGIVRFEPTYPIAPHNADAWMVQELTPGVMAQVQGKVMCADALDHAEYWIEK